MGTLVRYGRDGSRGRGGSAFVAGAQGYLLKSRFSLPEFLETVQGLTAHAAKRDAPDPDMPLNEGNLDWSATRPCATRCATDRGPRPAPASCAVVTIPC